MVKYLPTAMTKTRAEIQKVHRERKRKRKAALIFNKRLTGA